MTRWRVSPPVTAQSSSTSRHRYAPDGAWVSTYEWAAAGDGATRMTLHNRGEDRGVMKLFAPVMARAMRSANVKDLERIKAILEA